MLVHGAWLGGWCWKKVIPSLRAAGHVVFAPTLTGLGERAYLLTPEIDLDTHIEDVVAVLEYEDLTNVVLVGHSYAGMVIAGVAQKAAPRLTELVYLDAFLPENGKSVDGYLPAPHASVEGRVKPLDPRRHSASRGRRTSPGWPRACGIIRRGLTLNRWICPGS